MKESYEWYQTWKHCLSCKSNISPRHRIDGVGSDLCDSCFKFRARKYEVSWQDGYRVEERLKELEYN